LFYEHAGILLNLGESLSPVLIAKVQHGAPHPQNVLERFANPGEDSEEFGSDLASGFESEDEEMVPGKGAWMGDIEWIAFEVFQDDESDDEDDEEEESDTDTANDLLPAMSALKLDSSPITSSPPLPTGILAIQHQQSSLSLLEYLLRLAALQMFEQQSHMNLTDEHIVLFLRDDNPASRQQSAIEQERTLRHQSSQTSLSSDFSSRALHPQSPLSPPHTDELDRGTTPISSTPSPVSSGNPAKRNPRTRLERAMAADYDPMTLVTPIANRRIIRNRKNNGLLPNNKLDPSRNSNSAPSSLQKSFTVPKSLHDETNKNQSPLVGKGGLIPVRRRVVSSVAGVKTKYNTRNSKGAD
jgi:hypothetical protein